MTANAIDMNTLPPTVGQMCALYSPPAGTFDEMLAPDGSVRPHWQPFLDEMETMGCEELNRNYQEVVRLLRENGIAYNIHGDPQGVHRKWKLDIVPCIFSQTDWDTVEKGMIQRAGLLEMMLADFYGPRHLLRDGLLPADLLYRHPAFLRPCQGLTGHPPHRLFMHSADLARGPKGRMWVLNDHASRPNGIGYTLENRTALAEVMPDMLRKCKVRRLSDYFRTLRAEITSVSPRQKEDPRIVILSPGPGDEFYFEHSYMAAYLGYPVVQGEDLTVRDGAVWLKSLDGLMRVDIIIRNTNDGDCDPLELSQTSRHGVAGLLESARRKNTVLANPIGSSVLENPALMAFLPGIAQKLLGEDLKLPSVPTWWCGQQEGLQYVLEHLDSLIIKNVHRSPQHPPVYGSMLSGEEKTQWKAQIRQYPHNYVGQTQLCFSTSPSLEKNGFLPRHTVCRLFSAARQEGGYTLMPGGIARSSADKNAQVVSNRTGGVLKDIWVIADRPQKHISLWLHGTQSDRAFTRNSVMPSRMAENLFWVGRYAERIEALARMLRTALHVLTERELPEDELSDACLFHLLQGISRISLRPDFKSKDKMRAETEISEIIQDRESAGGIVSTLGFFLNAAYAVRDHWSADTWQVINGIEEYRRSIHLYSGFVPRLMQKHLDRLIRSLLAFTGLCMESMSREYGWMLLDTGRRIERALMFIAFVRSNLVPVHHYPLDNVMMEAVLITSENIITYRRRYRSYMEMVTVLDLLLMDERNPRSLLYQLDRLQEHIADLPRERDTYRLSEEERLMLKAVSRLRLCHTPHLAEISDRSGEYKRLDGLLDSIRRLLEKTSETVSQNYFSHIQESRLLGAAHAEVL
ncbi:MAG: circularly permuted type 2 ATP-grasp protein [Desulfococcaceae bacterium]|jgi:uncharacterized circularly permuted ATP-grasp superfamily protein/uncharacterized alpha-E superfamily protein|nr:circularly permuted type 2 ATP-grasp protein [Desulfococcaceae bacterium]